MLLKNQTLRLWYTLLYNTSSSRKNDFAVLLYIYYTPYDESIGGDTRTNLRGLNRIILPHDQCSSTAVMSLVSCHDTFACSPDMRRVYVRQCQGIMPELEKVKRVKSAVSRTLHSSAFSPSLSRSLAFPLEKELAL